VFGARSGMIRGDISAVAIFGGAKRLSLSLQARSSQMLSLDLARCYKDAEVVSGTCRTGRPLIRFSATDCETIGMQRYLGSVFLFGGELNGS